MTQINRNQFLRGKWKTKEIPVRPPWSVEEDTFIDRCRGCLRCGDCVSVCPEKILISGNGGFPVTDFTSGGCNFCGKCVEACPSGALDSALEQAWSYRGKISNGCLSIKGVECRSCGETCETAAISFHPKLGGVVEPMLDPHACTGCGECIGVCPVSALSIEIPREIIHE